MHARPRVRRAVRHVRRLRDRVRHRGRVPVAQVPGEAGDAEDHGRPGAPAHAAARRGRHRWLHSQLAGRHHGTEQTSRVQNGRSSDQTKQLIGDVQIIICVHRIIIIIFTYFIYLLTRLLHTYYDYYYYCRRCAYNVIIITYIINIIIIIVAYEFLNSDNFFDNRPLVFDETLIFNRQRFGRKKIQKHLLLLTRGYTQSRL